MGHFKSFLLGLGVAFGIYYITRKDETGLSVLDEILDKPNDFVNKAKDYAVEEVIQTVKKTLR